MAVAKSSPLPLQQVLNALDEWQADPTAEQRELVRAGCLRLIRSYGAEGAYLEVTAPPLPELSLGVGTLMERPAGGSPAIERTLYGARGSVILGRAWLVAAQGEAEAAGVALELAFDAAWSRAEARAAGRRLAALDAAVRGIAGVLDLERVLQLIVDRVRELSNAQYAALGIVGADGYLERFLTSGLEETERQRLGALPRGHGLLGLIIREDRSLRIDDIATDPRRAGFPPHHPEMHSFLGVPVRSKGHSIGNLYLTNKQSARSFSEVDQRLVEMFALHAGIAIENARLHEEVGRLAVLEDRHRIGQDLHDGIIQSLYAVALSLEDLPEIIADDQADGTARVDRAIDGIHQSIRDIRNFILGLGPELLETADLVGGLRTLASEFHANTLIDLELQLPDQPPRTSEAVASNLLAICREALSNVARHSGATRATVELHADGPTLRMIIGDNGRGFDPQSPRTREHRGLDNLQSRAETLGGTLELASEPGAGTRLAVSVPAATASEDDE